MAVTKIDIFKISANIWHKDLISEAKPYIIIGKESNGNT